MGLCWIFEKSPIRKYQVPNEGEIVGCSRTFCNQVDPETVCQYTGLKDYNNIRVFEGDVLSYSHLVDGSDCVEMVEVEWVPEYCAFYMTGSVTMSMEDIDPCTIDVIKNIHD